MGYPVWWLVTAVVFLGCAPRSGTMSVPTPGTAAPDSGVSHHVVLDTDVVEDGIGAEIDRYLLAAAEHGYGGIVLVAHRGRVILNRGYGWADRDRGVPFRASMRFPLASVDKTFTASAILRLQDLGVLSVHDTVSRHIPGWPPDKAAITIHQLLTHTSGLPLDVGMDEEVITRDEMLARAFRVELLHEPGSRWFYSNLGYSVLAAIVEEASGQPFEQFLQRELFGPAGMMHTRFGRLDDPQPLEFCGYRSFFPECIAPTVSDRAGSPSWIVVGGAGHVTTTADMYRWHLALEAGKVLSRNAQVQATRAYTRTSLGGSAGYGWFVLDRPGDRVVYHTGGNGIVATRFERFLDRELTIAQFTNNSAGVYRHIANEVTKIASGVSYEPLPMASRALTPVELRRHCGVYRAADGDSVRIEVKNGQLYAPLSATGGELATFLSGQPRAASTSERASATVTARRILGDVARGELSSLLANLPDGADVAEERWFWSTFWPTMVENRGAITNIVYVGSTRAAPSQPGASDGALEIRLLVHFERGAQYVRARALGDGRWYLSPSYQAPLPPGGFRFVPVDATTFLARTFATSTEAKLEFRGLETERVELVMDNGQMGLVAHRVAGC